MRSEQQSSPKGTTTQRGQRPLGDHPDEEPEDEDNPKHPPDPPPTPEAHTRHRDIIHKSNICLDILVNSEDKGHFLKFQTHVKVCRVIQN
jgi:hypothetical protein